MVQDCGYRLICFKACRLNLALECAFHPHQLLGPSQRSETTP